MLEVDRDVDVGDAWRVRMTGSSITASGAVAGARLRTAPKPSALRPSSAARDGWPAVTSRGVISTRFGASAAPPTAVRPASRGREPGDERAGAKRGGTGQGDGAKTGQRRPDQRASGSPAIRMLQRTRSISSASTEPRHQRSANFLLRGGRGSAGRCRASRPGWSARRPARRRAGASITAKPRVAQRARRPPRGRSRTSSRSISSSGSGTNSPASR